MSTRLVTFIWRGAVCINRSDPTYEVFEILNDQGLLSDLSLTMSDLYIDMEHELKEHSLHDHQPDGVYIVLLLGFIECWNGYDHEGTPDGSTELHITHSHWEPASKDDVLCLMDENPSLDLKEFL